MEILSRYQQKLLLAALLPLCLSAAPAPEEYRGICDASAGVFVSDSIFVVGNDEDNILRFYKVGIPTHLASMDVGTHFGGLDAKHELDIEAATQQGDYVYWATSHGRNKSGKLKKERYAFFATRLIAGKKLEEPTQRRPYQNLVEDMLAEPAISNGDAYGLARATRLDVARDALLAPKREGLNVEALAPFGKNGLYIGLRNPLKDGKAILIPFLNPREVVERSAKARFAKPVLLDLDGLAFRDMVKVSTGGVPEGYLIVAGSKDNSDNFGIFFWDEKNPPRRVAVDLGKLRPEAILLHPKRGVKEAMFLSDDGRQDTGGDSCKDLFARGEYKDVKFRAVWLDLSEAIKKAAGAKK